RHDCNGVALRFAFMRKADIESLACVLDHDIEAKRTEQHDPLIRTRRSTPCVRSIGYLTLPLGIDIEDGGGNGCELPRHLAFRLRRRESAREFLGDERRRKVSRTPPRMPHQRREERNVVADALDGK